MFKIGDFSRIARVSARLLRFYDEIGLLTPEQADPRSGYRYYSPAQLHRLNRILVLKDLGFQLDEIGRVLDGQPSGAELRAMLLVRRHDAARALEAEEQRLRQIEMRINQIESEGKLVEDDVIVRVEPARQYLSLRRTVSSFNAAREVVAEVRASARRCLPASQLGTLVIVAHASEFESDRLDGEFGFTLADDARPKMDEAGGLSLRELESVQRMAVCVRVGLPEEAHVCTAKIGRYLAASGDQLAGPSREYFLQLPPSERMRDAVVEMQFPIRSVK
jgi:DNA-binding transcriptional MerR regulator